VSIRLVEDGFASDGRHADAVSVVPDAGDRALEHPAGIAEAKPVEERDRPRAHRDDVSQDAADAGRGSLERLDRGRVVVALDLERDCEPVAEADDTGVFTRSLQDTITFRGQALQQEGRMLVPAVLRPEQGEDRELEVVGVSAEQVADTVELPVGQPEGAMQGLFRDLRQGPESSRLTRRPGTAFRKS
jgi:hypothetical protein